MYDQHSRTIVQVTAALVVIFALAACGATSTTPTSAPIAAVSTEAIESSASTETTVTEVVSTPEAAEGSSVTAEATSETGAATEAATCTKLDLNTLTEDELLATIPDFSNRMVREFFEYRPYVSIQQFRREIGKYVDEAQVAEYEQYVYVPIDPNEADAATLQQIPGVDETAAASLIAARPYESRQAFFDALASNVSEAEAAEANCYLVTSV